MVFVTVSRPSAPNHDKARHLQAFLHVPSLRSLHQLAPRFYPLRLNFVRTRVPQARARRSQVNDTARPRTFDEFAKLIICKCSPLSPALSAFIHFPQVLERIRFDSPVALHPVAKRNHPLQVMVQRACGILPLIAPGSERLRRDLDQKNRAPPVAPPLSSAAFGVPNKLPRCPPPSAHHKQSG